MKHFKVFMYKEAETYYIYSTETKRVLAYNQSDIDNMIASGEDVRNLKDRKEGTSAVVYQSDPERYIAVTPKGTHYFRTLRELELREEFYFNVNIHNHKVQALEGDIPKADEYTKTIAYIGMYKSTNPLLFEVDTQTGKTSIQDCKGDSIQFFKPPNFVIRIASKSFVNKQISELQLESPLKLVEKSAFEDCTIDRLDIERCSNNIEAEAFRGCKIKEVRLTDCKNGFTDGIFAYSIIGKLDLTYSKTVKLPTKLFTDVISIDTLAISRNMKTLNLDDIPNSVQDIILYSKNIKLQCKDKDRLYKLESEINRLRTKELRLTLN